MTWNTVEYGKELAAAGWRPIAAPPKAGSDYKQILTIDEHGGVMNNRGEDPSCGGFWQGGEWIPRVVGWMPMPTAEIPPAERAMWNALIDYVLETDQGETFLRNWREGDFQRCRDEWPDCPEELFPIEVRKKRRVRKMRSAGLREAVA